MRIILMLVVLLLSGCGVGQNEAVRVYLEEDVAELRRGVAERLEARIGGRVVERPEDADWIIETATDAPSLGAEGFQLQAKESRVYIRGNTRRARLYGLWELIEKKRRGERLSALDVEETPRYALRGDTQNPHTPYKLSRQETLEFWEEYFSWAMWMRMNTFIPFQSNGRVIVPRGYPDYHDYDYATGGGYYAMKRIYELCELYEIDFYYPLHLFPVPAETGFRDEPSTFNEFFYPDGAEDRVPRVGPMAKIYETNWRRKFPEYFDRDNRVDLSHPGVWRAIETEIRAAQELFPKMKGLFLNFAETNGHTQRFSEIHRGQNPWPILQRTFRFVREKAPDLQLALFHHGAGLLVFRGSNVRLSGADNPITALNKEFPDMLHVVDLHPGPQHPGQPALGSIGPPGERRRLNQQLKIVLWTICDGEHIGRTAVAYSVPGYIYSDMKEALALGGRGSLQRTANYDFGRVPGTLLEINAYTAYRLLWNPDVTLDELWVEWISSRFGPELVAPLREVLQPVEDVVRKGLILHNCPMFGTMGLQEAEHYMTGNIQNPRSFSAGIRYPTILDLFQPPGTLMHEVVVNNSRDRRFLLGVQQRARPIADILADREEALGLAVGMLERTEALESRLAAEDYALIHEAVENLRYVTEISKLFTEALYLEKMAFVNNYDDVEEPVRKFEDSLERLEERVYEIRRKKGEYFFYGIPQAMSCYRQIGRLRLEAAAATSGYKIR